MSFSGASEGMTPDGRWLRPVRCAARRRAGALGGAGHPAIKGTLTQCDPFGIPSTSLWTDVAIIVQ